MRARVILAVVIGIVALIVIAGIVYFVVAGGAGLNQQPPTIGDS